MTRFLSHTCDTALQGAFGSPEWEEALPSLEGESIQGWNDGDHLKPMANLLRDECLGQPSEMRPRVLAAAADIILDVVYSIMDTSGDNEISASEIEAFCKLIDFRPGNQITFEERFLALASLIDLYDSARPQTRRLTMERI